MSFTAAQAADYKIGVVNAPRILEAAPQAEVARVKLEKEFAARDQKLVGSQKDLKGLEDRIQKDGAIKSETERGKVERDIMAKRRDLKRDTTEFQEDVNFRRNEEMAIIQQQIGEAIVALSKEQGFDMVVGSWQGIFVPVGTPRPVVSKLFDVTLKAMKDPAVNKRLNDGGVPVIVSKSPEDFAKFVKAETDRFGKIISDAKIQTE